MKCARIFCSLPHFMSWNNGGWNGSPTAYQYTSLKQSGHLPDFEGFIMTRHQVTTIFLTKFCKKKRILSLDEIPVGSLESIKSGYYLNFWHWGGRFFLLYSIFNDVTLGVTCHVICHILKDLERVGTWVAFLRIFGFRIDRWIWLTCQKNCSKEVLVGLRESRNLKTFLSVQPFALETWNVKELKVWECLLTKNSWIFPAITCSFLNHRKSSIRVNMFDIHIAKLVKRSCPSCSTFDTHFGPLIWCFLMKIGAILELFTFS